MGRQCTIFRRLSMPSVSCNNRGVPSALHTPGKKLADRDKRHQASLKTQPKEAKAWRTPASTLQLDKDR